MANAHKTDAGKSITQVPMRGEQHDPMCLKQLEVGKLHQVSNVRRGKPVLFYAWHFHAEPFRKRH